MATCYPYAADDPPARRRPGECCVRVARGNDDPTNPVHGFAVRVGAGHCRRTGPDSSGANKLCSPPGKSEGTDDAEPMGWRLTARRRPRSGTGAHRRPLRRRQSGSTNGLPRRSPTPPTTPPHRSPPGHRAPTDRRHGCANSGPNREFLATVVGGSSYRARSALKLTGRRRPSGQARASVRRRPWQRRAGFRRRRRSVRVSPSMWWKPGLTALGRRNVGRTKAGSPKGIGVRDTAAGAIGRRPQRGCSLIGDRLAAELSEAGWSATLRPFDGGRHRLVGPPVARRPDRLGHSPHRHTGQRKRRDYRGLQSGSPRRCSAPSSSSDRRRAGTAGATQALSDGRPYVDAAGRSVTILENPTRVVTLAEGVLDAALALHVTPVGSTAGRGQLGIPGYLAGATPGASSIPIVALDPLPNLGQILKGAARPHRRRRHSRVAQQPRRPREDRPDRPCRQYAQGWERYFGAMATILNRPDQHKRVLGEISAMIAATGKLVAAAPGQTPHRQRRPVVIRGPTIVGGGNHRRVGCSARSG